MFEYYRIGKDNFSELLPLHIAYKQEIGEEPPSAEDINNLQTAVEDLEILFFGCKENGKPVGCCSVTILFTTYNYQWGGVFEDFYILPEYRHRGIAAQLVQFAYRESGVKSLTVGCADCDAEMYKALGFRIPLGNMLAFEE